MQHAGQTINACVAHPNHILQVVLQCAILLVTRTSGGIAPPPIAEIKPSTRSMAGIICSANYCVIEVSVQVSKSPSIWHKLKEYKLVMASYR